MTDNEIDNEQDNPESKEVTDTMMTSGTEVSASLAGLSLDVRTDDREECEEMFDRLWNKLMTDAENMSDNLNERMGGVK